MDERRETNDGENLPPSPLVEGDNIPLAPLKGGIVVTEKEG
ncbi:hypothetical protein RCZ04_21520 [Capnocytophaga sp. HP1101]